MEQRYIARAERDREQVGHGKHAERKSFQRRAPLFDGRRRRVVLVDRREHQNAHLIVLDKFYARGGDAGPAVARLDQRRLASRVGGEVKADDAFVAFSGVTKATGK